MVNYYPLFQWIEKIIVFCKFENMPDFKNDQEIADYEEDINFLFETIFEAMFNMAVKDAILNRSWYGQNPGQEDSMFLQHFFPLDKDCFNDYYNKQLAIEGEHIIELTAKGEIPFAEKEDWIKSLIWELREFRIGDGFNQTKFVRAYDKIVEILGSRELSLCKVKYYVNNHLQKWPEDVKALYENKQEK